MERQAAVLPTGRDLDAVGVYGRESGVSLGIVFVRQGRIIDGQTFWFAGASVDTPEEETALVCAFLTQFYTPERFIPPRVITALGVSDPALEEALSDMRGGRTVAAKARGEQERRLVDIATANARADHTQLFRSRSPPSPPGTTASMNWVELGVQELSERLKGHAAQVALRALAHRDLTLVALLVPDHDHVGHLL